MPPEPSKNDDSVSVASTEALAVTVNTVVREEPIAMPFDGEPPPSQLVLVDAPKSNVPYGLPDALTRRFQPDAGEANASVTPSTTLKANAVNQPLFATDDVLVSMTASDPLVVPVAVKSITPSNEPSAD